MDKLKTMVRKTEDRQQLGELMALVAEKTTVAVAHKPDRTESKVLSLCNTYHSHALCMLRSVAPFHRKSYAWRAHSLVRSRMHGYCSPCTCFLPFEKSCRHCRLLQ